MQHSKSSRTWGYLRETRSDAMKAGADPDTGLIRTGLDEYLPVIFPNIDDWVHDEPIGLMYQGKKLRTRPDYRSDSLRMIIEFDGIQHYQSPERILRDGRNTLIYRELGYDVVRIPYFIQLTNDAINQLFGIEVNEPMFDVSYPSLGVNGRCTPAYLCPSGIDRMAKDFLRFPDQLDVNLKALEAVDNEFLTGAKLLMASLERVRNQL